MVRVATHTAALVLVDCVSPEDPEKRTYRNCLEKLRTPSKTYVCSEPQLVAAHEQVGLVIAQRARCSAQMGVDVWIRAAGPDVRGDGQRTFVLLPLT
jgi:hypothetical protein